MYTQCPDCGSAFRVTADVLKQAAGKVRCGGCGHAFNALLYLSETKPEAKPPEDLDESLPELIPDPDDEDSYAAPKKISAAQSAALLKTLDQLAGEDIQLEDTGVEWRLLGDDDDDNDNDDGVTDPYGAEQFDEDEPIPAGGYDVEETLAEADEEIDRPGQTEQAAPPSDALEVDASVDEIFAGTETRLDADLLNDTGAAKLDEMLDNTPTPIDEFLTVTPNQVDAKEVFTPSDDTPEFDAHEVFASSDEQAELDAAEVFSAPAQADELRFDDNTGLPDNFELDDPGSSEDLATLPPATDAAAKAEPGQDDNDPRPTNAEQANFDAAFEIGGVDEWDDLLAEVEPPAASTQDDLLASADAASAIPDADAAPDAPADDRPPLTLAEELAALPDDDDWDAVADEQPGMTTQDPVAGAAAPDVSEPLPTAASDDPAAADSLNFDLSGIYEIEPEPDATAVASASATQAVADGDASAGALPESEPADGDPHEPHPAASAPREAQSGLGESSVILKQTVDVFPDSTSELEFELVNAQAMVDQEVDLKPEHVIPEPTAEEQTVNMQIDQDLMRLAIPDDDGMASTMVLEGRSGRVKSEPGSKDAPPDKPGPDTPADKQSTQFETIVMEGSFVRTALEQERLAAEAEARGEASDDLAAGIAAQHALDNPAEGGHDRNTNYRLIAGIVVLALLLAGQFVHQSRAELATIPAIANAIGPLYSAVGAPISPDWNVKGWRFQKSSASTNPNGLAARIEANAAGKPLANAHSEDKAGADVLTIYSLLSNESTSELPYPLINVSLLDRFEEPVGSKVYEPGDYLQGNFNANRRVPPGGKFEAVISIESPSASLDNFKLNACYRQSDGRLRCAFEDFK